MTSRLLACVGFLFVVVAPAAHAQSGEGGGGRKGAQVASEKADSPRGKAARASVLGAAAGLGAGAAFLGASAAIAGAVALGPSIAWATQDTRRFQGGMFVQLLPSLVGVLLVAVLPLAGLTAAVVDAGVFSWLLGGGQGFHRRVLETMAMTSGPVLAAYLLSATLVVLHLALLASVASSSLGNRLPGDPGGYTSLFMLGGAALAGGFAVVLHMASVVVRPLLWARGGHPARRLFPARRKE